MSQESQNATPSAIQLPTVLVLGGITHRVEDNAEILAFRNLAQQYGASTEKSKLYSTIQDLKTQINALKTVEIDASKVPGVDTEKLIASLVEKLGSEMQKLIALELKPIKDAAEVNLKADADTYKATLLAANTDKCFPDLVEGTTKAEIDASLEKSATLHAKYFPEKHIKGNQGQQNNTSSNTSTNQPSTQNNGSANTQNANQNNGQQNNNNNGGSANAGNSNNTTPVVTAPIKTGVNDQNSPVKTKMSHEEYAKNRENLLKHANSLLDG